MVIGVPSSSLVPAHHGTVCPANSWHGLTARVATAACWQYHYIHPSHWVSAPAAFNSARMTVGEYAKSGARFSLTEIIAREYAVRINNKRY